MHWPRVHRSCAALTVHCLTCKWTKHAQNKLAKATTPCEVQTRQTDEGLCRLSTVGCHTQQVNSPAVDDLWSSSLEAQSVRDSDCSVQNALLTRLIPVHKEAVDVALPLLDWLATISVVLVSGSVVANRSLNSLQVAKKGCVCQVIECNQGRNATNEATFAPMASCNDQ